MIRLHLLAVVFVLPSVSVANPKAVPAQKADRQVDLKKLSSETNQKSGAPSNRRITAAKKDALKRQPIKNTAKKTQSNRGKTAQRARKKRFKQKQYPVSRPEKVDLRLPNFKARPFREGERLHFNVMMFGQLAGETILAVGQNERKSGRNLIPLGGFLRGAPFLNKFYPIENSLHVWLDAESYKPVLSEFAVNENRKVMSYTTRYDQRRRRVSSRRVKGTRKLTRHHRPVSDVYEPLGCIYAIRAMDLKVGDSFNYYLFDGRKERFVTVQVLGEEDVVVPAGLFTAKKIAISTKITGGFISERMLELPPRKGIIWIANDEWRTPLKMIAETKLGPAEAMLTKRYFESGEISFP